MRVDFLIEGEVAIVQLQGRFTTGSDAEFVRANEELAGSGDIRVVSHCSHVPFGDWQALNFLVGRYKTAKNAGGMLALCGVNQRMRDVLRITHLNEILPVHETRERALAALMLPEQ